MKNGMRKTAGILGIVLGTSLVYSTAYARHTLNGTLNVGKYVECFKKGYIDGEKLTTPFKPGEIIISFDREEIDPKEAMKLIEELGYKKKISLDLLPWEWLIEVPVGEEEKIVGKFKCLLDIIENAEPNYNLELRNPPDLLMAPPGKGVKSPK